MDDVALQLGGVAGRLDAAEQRAGEEHALLGRRDDPPTGCGRLDAHGQPCSGGNGSTRLNSLPSGSVITRCSSPGLKRTISLSAPPSASTRAVAASRSVISMSI